MKDSIVFTNAQGLSDLEGILALQKKNHYTNISQEVANKEGFVTCMHDLELIQKMNSPHAHVIAKVDDRVVAYALVMTREHCNAIDVLKTMFDKINTLNYIGNALVDSRYVVMGQICIAEEYRSMGIFKNLYANMKEQLGKEFDYIITEVDDDNKRSLAAHARCGFLTIEVYTAGKDWHLMLLETH